MKVAIKKGKFTMNPVQSVETVFLVLTILVIGIAAFFIARYGSEAYVSLCGNETRGALFNKAYLGYFLASVVLSFVGIDIFLYRFLKEERLTDKKIPFYVALLASVIIDVLIVLGAVTALLAYRDFSFDIALFALILIHLLAFAFSMTLSSKQYLKVARKKEKYEFNGVLIKNLLIQVSIILLPVLLLITSILFLDAGKHLFAASMVMMIIGIYTGVIVANQSFVLSSKIIGRKK